MSIYKSLALILLASPFSLAHDTWENRAGLLTGSNISASHVSYIGGRFIMSSSSSTYWHSVAGTAGWTSATLPISSSRGMATDGDVMVISGTSNMICTNTAATIAGLPSTPATWALLSPAVRSSGVVNFGRVRHLNGQFILTTSPYNDAVDNANSYTELLTSPDGTTWTSKKFMASTLGSTTYTLIDIAFKPGVSAGTGTYVATTTSSSIILTFPEDLSSATRVTVSGLSTNGQSVIFANGIFVMVTKNGKIFTSSTGAAGSWTERPNTTNRLNDVFHDGTHFIAVGNVITGSSPGRPSIYKSTDAVTWTEATTVPTGNELLTVFKADGLWVAGGTTRTLYTSGSSSFSPPTVAPLSSITSGLGGGLVTINASVGGIPAPTVFEWFKNGTPITDGSTASGSVVSGAGTASLTISGLALSDAGNYFVRVTNTVSSVNSTITKLIVSNTSNGATITPFGVNNVVGGAILEGTSPVKVLAGSSPATFTREDGLTYLPNTFVNPNTYSVMGGANPSGTKFVLGVAFGFHPLMIYELGTQTGTLMPPFPLPMGPITAANLMFPVDIADNGDVTGIIQDSGGQNHGFHFSDATQTYTLLGNVPNIGNDIASNPGAISADGTTIAGYERTGLFNGAFMWQTSGGFTLLPDPENGGIASADIREISPDARYIVGFGAASAAMGDGQTAMRWDRGAGLGAPVGFALPKRLIDTFADAICVNNDGTTGGNVRAGSNFANNRAAVWLPNGALIVLPDYLSSRYGLTTPGFTLTHVTSISADLRTISGTARNDSNQSEGWLLTLPDPLSITTPASALALRIGTATPANGANFFFGTIQIGGGVYPTRSSFVGNLGSSDLTVSSAAISGPNAADFTIIFTPPVTQIPGTYGINRFTPFTIRFEPQPGDTGARAATLTIASDDPTNPSFVVNLSATATAPPSQTPAQIALENFLVAANVPANLRGPLDDPNGDGVNNLLAFALGLPPMAHAVQPGATDESGVLTLTYTRAQQSHVAYTVKTSIDLGVTDLWTSAGVNQGTPDGNGMTNATIPIDGTPRFLRIEVVLTP